MFLFTGYITVTAEPTCVNERCSLSRGKKNACKKFSEKISEESKKHQHICVLKFLPSFYSNGEESNMYAKHKGTKYVYYAYIFEYHLSVKAVCVFLMNSFCFFNYVEPLVTKHSKHSLEV